MQTQEALDGEGLLQSHQWAELPAAIAAPFLTGGLKHVRRLTERYCSFGFLNGVQPVRGAWRAGEPHLRWRFYHLPGLHGRELVHLGRLRLGGTLDVYRGFHAVRGGQLVGGAAGRAWPVDMPWVAPSAGECSESDADAYRGILEVRVERRPPGAVLHVLVVDVPPSTTGLAAQLWKRSWVPLGWRANAAFLRQEIAAAARAQGDVVRFELQARAGVPARLRFHFDPALPRVV